jgi:hypothetical protein
MSFADQLAADRAVFLNASEFAETVTYAGVPGIVAMHQTDVQQSERPADYYGDFSFLFVSSSDVAVPSYRDTVVIGSDTWKVFSDQERYQPELSGGIWKIPLYKNEKPSVWNK